MRTLFTDGALLVESESLIYLQSIAAVWRLTQHSTTTGTGRVGEQYNLLDMEGFAVRHTAECCCLSRPRVQSAESPFQEPQRR
jgi:hypothetical protein